MEESCWRSWPAWPPQLASTAGAGSTTAARSQAVSCKGTLKIGFAAPFTGGAAFLGNEQLSWAKYAVKTLAPKYGLKISLVTGDIPVESGPAGALTVAQKFVADKNVVVSDRPVHFGFGRRVEQDVLRRPVSRTSRRRRHARRSPRAL